MGYTTNFEGSFEFNKQLSPKMLDYLKRFNDTRRMARNTDEVFGTDGEFFVFGGGFAGQDHEDNILDYNKPPKTQPGLWCQWTPNEDGTELEWDGGEKFYEYTEWLYYLINKILAPNGYVLNGEVDWSGEESGDVGTIHVIDNIVYVNGTLFNNDNVEHYVGYGKYKTCSMELDKVLILDNVEKVLKEPKKVTEEDMQKAVKDMALGLLRKEEFEEISNKFVETLGY